MFFSLQYDLFLETPECLCTLYLEDAPLVYWQPIDNLIGYLLYKTFSRFLNPTMYPMFYRLGIRGDATQIGQAVEAEKNAMSASHLGQILFTRT